MLSLRKGTDFVPSDLPKMDLSEKAIMFEVSFGEDALPLLNPPQKIIFDRIKRRPAFAVGFHF